MTEAGAMAFLDAAEPEVPIPSTPEWPGRDDFDAPTTTAPEPIASPDPGTDLEAVVVGNDTAEAPAAVAAPERGPIPYERFQAVVQERNTAREAFSKLDPWQTAIEQIQALGYTPEQVLEQAAFVQAQLAAPPARPEPPVAPVAPPVVPEPVAAPDPVAEQTFEQWAEEGGISADDLLEIPPAQYRTLEASFRAEQRALQAEARVNAFEAQQQAAAQQQQAQAAAQEEARFVQQVQANLTQLSAQFPVLGDEFVGESAKREVVSAWYDDPERRPLSYHAEQLQNRDNQRVEKLLERQRIESRNALVTQAVQTPATPAAVVRPVTAGGGAPSVAERPTAQNRNVHQVADGALAYLSSLERAGS